MSESFSPDSSFSDQPPASKGMSGMKIALIVVGILGVLGLLGCGCCAGVMWFGVGQVKDNMVAQAQEHPIVQEKIGAIESSSFNFQATGAEGEAQVMVLDVSGPKGSGQLIGKQGPGGVNFEWIQLRTDEGEWMVKGER